MNKISLVLNKLLSKRRMTVSDLSRQTGIVQPVIYRMTTGETDNPKIATLIPIANYFNISVGQLIGEEPLSKTNQDMLVSTNNNQAVPLLTWDTLDNLDESINKGNKEISVTGLSNSSFALLMPDSSMEPLFHNGSLLIFDKQVKPKDRSYVLAKLASPNIYIFRQLLIDINYQYLKPLNPDLSTFQMRLLEQKDEIVACLIESRQNHQRQEAYIEGTTGKDILIN